MAKIPLKVKVNVPYFQYQPSISHDACLVQSWGFQPKAAMINHTDNPNFLEFNVKMAKMTFKVKINYPYFHY